ncbi:pentapeptide repeat-containing protein [Pigmentiphaga litoralis]|uniref:pentapeptide repeat-containing protein n=1 Tax=Pigmentiphaga litoralis TaxID=516702 RepID=UPI003B438CBC
MTEARLTGARVNGARLNGARLTETATKGTTYRLARRLPTWHPGALVASCRPHCIADPQLGGNCRARDQSGLTT